LVSRKTYKICIVGSSVGLRARPSNQVLNYGKILNGTDLKNLHLQVTNRSCGRYTSREVLSSRDLYIREYADLYIINIGAVDAPSREIPFWYSDILYNRRKSIFYNILYKVYYAFISKYRKLFTYLRLKKSWISKSEFTRNIKQLIECIQKDTNSRILILGINSGNMRIERQLPGTLRKYQEYNVELKNIADQFGLSFLDVSNLESEEYFPDGVHYNEKGHKFISEKVLNYISNFSS